jgi:hypothetical protein
MWDRDIRIMPGRHRSCIPGTNHQVLRHAGGRLGCRRGVFSLWASDTLFAACVVCGKCNRADWPAMGNHFPGKNALAKFDALLAMLLPRSPALAMLRKDTLAVSTIIIVMVNIPMLWRILSCICVIRRYSGHWSFFRIERLRECKP